MSVFVGIVVFFIVLAWIGTVQESGIKDANAGLLGCLIFLGLGYVFLFEIAPLLLIAIFG